MLMFVSQPAVASGTTFRLPVSMSNRTARVWVLDVLWTYHSVPHPLNVDVGPMSQINGFCLCCPLESDGARAELPEKIQCVPRYRLCTR